MRKLIIFDLDGVLIESRHVHYETLNKALANIDEKYTISVEEHLSTYDGLATSKKLKLLTEKKNLPIELYDIIWREKQKNTWAYLKTLPVDIKLIDIFKKLKNMDYFIAVASNSVRESVKLALLSLGLMEYVDYFVSNEDVIHIKPFPEMYWQCMTKLNCLPKNTIIVEDSHIGRTAALNSGAHLLPVQDTNQLNWALLLEKIKETNTEKQFSIPWIDKKLNVIIPMAGLGSRFSEVGYTFPKPLIEVNNKPMIQVVVENLNISANYIFIVNKNHYEKYNLKYLLNLAVPNCKIIQVESVTEGAACTTLLAEEYINNQNPLLIVNSDQFVEWDSNECLYALSADNVDGGILTFQNTHPKWSYVKLGDNGFVTEVAEKRVISNEATVGIYYWRQGSDYVKYAKQMMDKNLRVNNEFYICPVFNEAIADNKKIKTVRVKKMWGLGTPEDLRYFLENHKPCD